MKPKKKLKSILFDGKGGNTAGLKYSYVPDNWFQNYFF